MKNTFSILLNISNILTGEVTYIERLTEENLLPF